MTVAVPSREQSAVSPSPLTAAAAALPAPSLCRTDDGHDARTGKNAAVPGLTVSGKIGKMGYKGVDTTELLLADVHHRGPKVPRTGTLGCYPSFRRAAQA